MPKRLFWMSSGYAAGAASSWWMQRKVKQTAEKVLPTVVRNQITTQVTHAGDRAKARVAQNPAAEQARKAWRQVRPDIDLTVAEPEPPALELIDGGLEDSTLSRIRERARRVRS
jgi:hypothetical protein